jgi:hypothetical protein
MRIDQGRWLEDVGTIIKVIMVTDAEANEVRARKVGLDLPAYAALTVLQYLVDHHGRDLKVIARNKS